MRVQPLVFLSSRQVRGGGRFRTKNELYAPARKARYAPPPLNIAFSAIRVESDSRIVRSAAKQIFSAIQGIALQPPAARYCGSVFRSSFSLLVSCLCTRWLCRSFAVLSPARRRPLALRAAGWASRCGKIRTFCLPKRYPKGQPPRRCKKAPQEGGLWKELSLLLYGYLYYTLKM